MRKHVKNSYGVLTVFHVIGRVLIFPGLFAYHFSLIIINICTEHLHATYKSSLLLL